MYKKVFQTNGQAKPVHKQITIKKERGFFIKNEPIEEDQLFTCENVYLREDPIIKLQKKHVRELSDLKQKCVELTRQNKILSAQLKQLKTGVSENRNKKTNEQIQQHDSDSSMDSDEYEVEKILKKKKGKEVYLVRWKGFGSNFDTWERKENLIHCPKLLKEFQCRV